jgi:4-amino-4-deoxy-L-arabinose transferase-like glycosyltransferase
MTKVRSKARDVLVQLREHLPFIILLVVAAVLYVAVASVQWYAIDEGSYLDAANTVVSGGVPFHTFAAREPVMIYYLSAGVSLFGPSLFVARLQIILVDMLTAVGVYLLGRELGGKNAGLAAAGIFLFNPFDVYSFTTVLLEPLAALPLIWIAYLLLRRSPPDSRWVPAALGLLLGVAELTRRDSVLLVPLILAVLIVRLNPRSLAERFKAIGFLILGFAIPVGLVLGYFVSVTSLPWMWAEYGLGGAYASNPVAFNYHLGVLYYVWVYEPFLVIPAVAVVAGNFAARGRLDLAYISLFLSAALLSFVLFTGPPNYSWGQGEFSFVPTTAILIIVAMIWLLTAMDLNLSERPGPRLPYTSMTYLGGWILFYLAFYTLVYPEFFTNYFSDLSVPLSLLAGLWWADRAWTRVALNSVPADAEPEMTKTRKSKGWVPAVTGLFVTTVLVGAALFSAVGVLGPSNSYNQPLTYDLSQYNVVQRTYSPTTVQDVANYLDAHSPPNATLFSADDIFLAEAHRSNLMNLSIVLVDINFNAYPNNQTAYPYDPFNLAPSVDELLATWNKTWVPLVVVGFSGTILEERHPLIGQYIDDNYHMVATFGNGYSWNFVSVWARGQPQVNAAALTGQYPVGPQPISIAMDTQNGTVFTGSLNSSIVSGISANGSEWSFNVPNCPGVRVLAFDSGTNTLWVGFAGSEVARYSIYPGKAPSMEGESAVGYIPTSITFDDRHHLAMAASQVFSNVTVLNSTTGAFVTDYKVEFDPSAIAYDPSSGMLLEASAWGSNIEEYNETSGVLIATFPLGIEPDNLVVTPSYYLVASWSPGNLLMVNPTTGQIVYTLQAQYGALGIAVSGNTIAVANQLSSSVQFYNMSSALPEGMLLTGGCPTALTFSSSGDDIYEDGPCAQPLDVWKMNQMVSWTVDFPTNGKVELYGNPVPEGVPLSVYPGLFWVSSYAPGSTQYETVTCVSGQGTWNPPMGPSVSSVQALQNSFALGSSTGAAFLIILAALAPQLQSLELRRRSAPPDGQQAESEQ